MKQIYSHIILALFGFYISYLVLTSRLNFYVHPRYTQFTMLMGMLALVVGVVGIIRELEQRRSLRIRWRELAAVSILLIPLAFGFLLPVKPLSAATAGQRSVDFNSLRSREISTADLFIQNTQSYSLGDWVSALNLNPNLDDYMGKKVKVSGFVYAGEQKSSDHFLISRFVITCCAVDARPIGMHVQLADWQSRFAENQWLEVVGEFVVEKIGEQDQLVIKSTAVKQINIPENPYIF